MLAGMRMREGCERARHVAFCHTDLRPYLQPGQPPTATAPGGPPPTLPLPTVPRTASLGPSAQRPSDPTSHSLRLRRSYPTTRNGSRRFREKGRDSHSRVSYQKGVVPARPGVIAGAGACLQRKRVPLDVGRRRGEGVEDQSTLWTVIVQAHDDWY